MKKTLLSVLAGLTVIGSASALPTPEEVKKMCEQDPTRYVWVEKTQACIEINPCFSDKEEIRKAYCAPFGLENQGDEKRKLVHQRYIEQVLKTKITEAKPVLRIPGDWWPTYINGYVLQDGGYIAFKALHEVEQYPSRESVRDACLAYGYDASREPAGCHGSFTDTECTNIADFASLLSEKLCQGFVDGNFCKIDCAE